MRMYAWWIDQYAYPKGNELSGRFLRTKCGIVLADSEEQARDIVWQMHGNDCACNLVVDLFCTDELKPGYVYAFVN